MKNIVMLLLVGLAVGCISNIDETYVEEQVYEENDNYDMSDYAKSGVGHGSYCPTEIIEFEGPDGEIFVMEMPGLCNPFELYDGYPAPDKGNLKDKINDSVDDPVQEKKVNHELNSNPIFER